MRGFDPITLRIERLVLRPLREEDAADLFGIFSDPNVMRYWTTPPWPTMQVAQEAIARDTSALASGEYLRLGIERHTDGRLWVPL